MDQYRLLIGNPGAGKSTLANCIAKQGLFKSGISFGSGKTSKLETKEHKGIVYLDTPGLADIKMRQDAARAITEALRKKGQYQIFFVVTLSAGRFRPEDLTTIWLVILNTQNITVVNIIINKLSKAEYQSLKNKDEMVESSLIAPLEMMSMRTKCNVFLLLHDEKLADADDTYAQYPELDKFVNNAPWVDVDPRFVKDIPGDEKSFEKLLDSLIDKINHSTSIHLLRKVRLVNVFFCYFCITGSVLK